MVSSDIKILPNMKSKGEFSIEKTILKCEKVSCINFSNHLQNIF